MMKKIALILFIILLSINVLYSQNTQVVIGKTYTLNDLPVMGLSIKSKKSKGATSSDSLGNFIITCMSKDKLIIKGKIFLKQKVKINPNQKDSLKIKLNFIPTINNMDIAVGYGYVKADELASSIQAIQNDNVYYSTFHSVYDIIKQKYSGAMIYGDEVVLRGPGSINNSNGAMFIVDGVEVNSLDYITPSDVKSISIIKDGSASIYGVRGANGVIIIELKTGGDNL